MGTQINSFKHLSEPTWKSMAAKHKVKDNGLARALSDCTKQAGSDEFEDALESLAQVTELVRKLRAAKEVATNRDVCAYLDNVTKEVGKARSAVDAELKDSAKSDAEEEKSEADEKKLIKLIGAQILSGFQKAKTAECSVLLCVATPVCGLAIASQITSQHKAQLTKCTESAKYLPLGGCIWDEEKRAYIFIMSKQDAGLRMQLEQAIKYFTRTTVKVIVTTRSQYEKSQNAEAEAADEQADKKDEVADEEVEEERESSEPDEEPLLTGVRPFDIGGSVGQGGKNAQDDVLQVQIALNRKGAKLSTDGKIGLKTVQAIRDIQKRIGLAYADGLVEVGKKTATALASSGSGSNYAPGGGGGGGGSGGAYGGDGGQYAGGGSGGNTGKYAGGSSGKYSGGSTGKYAGGSAGGNTGKYAGGSSGKYSGGNTGGYSGGNTGGYSGGNTGGYSGGSSGEYSGGKTGGYSGGTGGGYSGGGKQGYVEPGGEYGATGAGAQNLGSGRSDRIVEGSGISRDDDGVQARAEQRARDEFDKRKGQVEGVIGGLGERLGIEPE